MVSHLVGVAWSGGNVMFSLGFHLHHSFREGWMQLGGNKEKVERIVRLVQRNS